MRKLVVGAAVLAAVVAVAVYFLKDSAEQAPAKAGSASSERVGDGTASPAEATSRSTVDAAANPAPADPRLAALQVSPDNGQIEFVAGPDGKVIKEIDKNPSSLGYMKPTREYMYAGDKVVGLLEYHYFGDRVEITRTAVSYKPDGSVDQVRKSTSYDFGKKDKAGSTP